MTCLRWRAERLASADADHNSRRRRFGGRRGRNDRCLNKRRFCEPPLLTVRLSMTYWDLCAMLSPILAGSKYYQLPRRKHAAFAQTACFRGGRCQLTRSLGRPAKAWHTAALHRGVSAAAGDVAAAV